MSRQGDILIWDGGEVGPHRRTDPQAVGHPSPSGLGVGINFGTNKDGNDGTTSSSSSSKFRLFKDGLLDLTLSFRNRSPFSWASASVASSVNLPIRRAVDPLAKNIYLQMDKVLK